MTFESGDLANSAQAMLVILSEHGLWHFRGETWLTADLRVYGEGSDNMVRCLWLWGAS